MKNSIKTFLRNFSYVLTSNIVTLLISTIILLVVPKLIGVEEYSYWQLYLFYSSFVGFLHFGWSDGIYLRYGGQEYKELDKKNFFSQFIVLIILQTLIAIIVWLIASLVIQDVDKTIIFKLISICLFIVNIRHMLLFILQATNRIKEYAKTILLEKIIFLISIIFILLKGLIDYDLLIWADLIGKFSALIYCIYICKDIVFNKFNSFYLDTKEIIENIRVGMVLMFANISSMLIIGNIRFGIERSWSVLVFGKISLILSLSSLVMLFINAIGLLMFPLLRRTEERKLGTIYKNLRNILMIILFGTLLLYYPLSVLIEYWLPAYSDSIHYLALLLPMIVYEGKMAILINTYLKTLRKEKVLLRVNILTFGLSLLLTLFSTVIFKNLDFAVLSIIIVLCFRGIVGEVILSSIMKVSLSKEIFIETIIILSFIILSWYLTQPLGTLVYLFLYTSYLVVMKNEIIGTYKKFFATN